MKITMKLRSCIKIAAILAAVIVSGLPLTVHANPIVQDVIYSINGSPWYVLQLGDSSLHRNGVNFDISDLAIAFDNVSTFPSLSLSGSISNPGLYRGELTILFSATGFEANSDPDLDYTMFKNGFAGFYGSTGSDSFTFQGFVDPANRPVSASTGLPSGGSSPDPIAVYLTNPSSGSFSDSASIGFALPDAPYSFLGMLQFDLGWGSTVTFDATTGMEPVPEPASVALLGLGLTCLGLVRRRFSH
jgi:hypothetical protein